VAKANEERSRRRAEQGTEARVPVFEAVALCEFSRAHPEVLARYREDLAQVERRDQRAEVDPVDEGTIAEALMAALRAIPPGNEHASEYHNLIIGAVEFLFFPRLIYRSIHGRSMKFTAKEGFL
jgi:hypothetical protein